MLLQNKAKRLITINTPFKHHNDPVTGALLNVEKGPRFQILPAGPAVDVPDQYLAHSTVKNFIGALVHAGDLAIIGDSEVLESEPESTPSEYDGMPMDELIETAELMGVTVPDGANEATIISLLDG